VRIAPKERGVKYGVAEHAGTKENQCPIVLSNDHRLTYLYTAPEGIVNKIR